MDGGLTAPTEAPLGVAASVSGRRWAWRLGDARIAAGLAQRTGLSELTARILAGRGITAETVGDFLAPSLRALMPDPSSLADMDRAATRLAAAVGAGERVAVFGDYDVDGACATALLCHFLGALGVAAEPYIPDRALEGYGPNEAALAQLADRGARLIVCVDCGTAGEAAIASIAGRADVLVLDHHAVDALPASAHAVVNPNRPDDRAGLGGLCATAVTLMAAVATNRALRRAGWFRARPEPDLLGLLDLVALATVCDVMPLAGLNRAFVAQGLRVMAQAPRPGLAALAEVAGQRAAPDAWHLGYVFGPRINAGGRVGQAELGTRLLLAPSLAEARPIAELLDATNRRRREIEAGVLAPALEQGAAQLAAGHGVLLVAGAGWHAGVVGIVAGRLKEQFNRPSLALAIEGDTAKGSGRSVAGIDLGAALIAARQAGLVSRAGGHAMAAGFALPAGGIAALHAFLETRLAATAHLPEAAELAIDGSLAMAGATGALGQELARLAPFGQGHPEPVFAMPHAMIAKAERIGAESQHVRAFLSDAAGLRLRAVAFRCADAPLGQALLGAAGRALHLAGHLRQDSWGGREGVSLTIVDAATA